MTPEAALRRALRGPGLAAPVSVADFVELAGGRPELARLSLGMDAAGRLPARGSRERRAYTSRLRAIQRYTTGAGERRTPGAAIRGQLEAATRPIFAQRQAAARASWLGRIRERGARCRVFGDVVIAGYPLADKEMPVGGPGVLLPAGSVRAFTDLAAGGKWDEAVAVFTAEFGVAYGVDLEVIDDAEYIRLWLDGDPEN